MLIKLYLHDSDLINVAQQEVVQLLQAQVVPGVDLTVRAGAAAGPPAAQSAAVGRAVAGDPALPDGGAAGVGVLLLGLGGLILRTGWSHEVRIMSGLTPVFPAW